MSIPSITDRLEASTAKAENASQIMHDVANGGPLVEVPTESGPVPSIQRWFADLNDRTSGAVGQVEDALDQEIQAREQLGERVDSAILHFPDYASASAAAATLRDGQNFIIGNDDQHSGARTLNAVLAGNVVFKSVEASTYLPSACFATRSDFVGSVGLPWEQGQVVSAGGFFYVSKIGSTAISDLPGFEPFLESSPQHWGAEFGVPCADAVELSAQWAIDNGREWLPVGTLQVERNISLVLGNAGGRHFVVSKKANVTILGTQSSPNTAGWAEYTGGWTAGDISYNSDQLFKISNQSVESGATSVAYALGQSAIATLSAAVQVGDMVVFTSTAPIPVEDRGGKNTFGQVLLVASISGGQTRFLEQLECDIPAGSQYEVYRPNTVQISGGMRFQRTLTTNATAADLGYRGMTIAHAVTPFVAKVSFDGFSECGFRYVECYKPRTRNIKVNGANRAYDTSDGTGYGISVVGCYDYKGNGNSFSGCRRGADLGTFGIVSWFCQEIDPVTTSGGLTYTGLPFWPDGVQHTSAVGSHGPSYYAEFVDVKAVNCRYHHLLRGFKEGVIGGVHYGHGKALGVIYGSGGSTIDGVTYDDGASRDGTYPAGYDNTKRMEWLTSIALGTVEATLPITLRNINANSISNCVVSFEGSGSVPLITTENVSLSVSKTGKSVNSFQVFGGTSTGVVLKTGTDLSGIKYRIVGAAYGDICKIRFSANLSIPLSGHLKIDDSSFAVRAASGAVATLPVSSDAAVVKVDVSDNNATPAFIGIGIALGLGRGQDISPLAAVNKTNVGVMPAPLTGTTGTAGNLTLSLTGTGGVSGRLIHIENRTGAERYVFMNIAEFSK